MTDIPANASTTATIAIGASVTGTIDTLGDHDWFRVNLIAGHTYVFTLDSTDVLGGIPIGDPEFALLDAAGTMLAFNDDIDPGIIQNSQITFTAATSGVYYLDAGGFSDSVTGDYRMSAFDVQAPISLDAIADYLRIGYAGALGGLPYHFATNTITYSLQGLTVAEQTLAHLALQAWDDVGAFTFVETSGAAALTFDNSGSEFAETVADGVTANVHISTDWNFGDLSISGYQYQTYVHEIGHALGLGHAGPYNGTAVFGVDNLYANDSVISSVMSYFFASEAGTGTDQTVMGPQLADIIAIGDFYGLSTATRTSDTTYGFNSNAGQIYNFADPIYAGGPLSFTIFDNGGADTIDVSGYGHNQRVDLNAEAWSDVGGAINNIAIARGAVIENVFGGSGDDTITGNSADNTIYGGAGADHILGNGGNDIVFGGAGHDIISGGDGNDTLVGNADIFAQESDTLDGGTGNDVFYGDFTDVIVGGTGTDFLYAVNSYDWNINLAATGIEWMFAGFGDDTINAATQTASVEVYGSGGNDFITGSAFDDFLWAGVGNDSLVGGAGNDMLFGDVGADSLSGGAGDDRLYVDSTDTHIDGGAGFDAVYITSGPGMTFDMAAQGVEWVADFAGGNDTFDGTAMTADMTAYAGAGADHISGGLGNDFLWGEAGNDNISGGSGNDVLVGGTGADILTGGAGIDVIYLNSGGGSDGALDQAVFTIGWGTDFVFDFVVGEDKLDLTALGTSFGALNIANVSGHAYVTIGAGTDLIAVANNGGLLHESDFLF